jgi:uncharacterized protein YcbX
MITISDLYYYPVKSCKGIRLEQARIGIRGISGDREFMVVDGTGSFLTQRSHARLALIQPDWNGSELTLSAPGAGKIVVTPEASGKSIRVEIWKSMLKADDQGNTVAGWLSDFLGTTCRLVHFAPDQVRGIDPKYRISETDQISFADAYPFLLLSESSLSDLNRRLDSPITTDRFRPNIVIRGSQAYAEDNWDRIRAGEIVFKLAKPCARCVITTIDQDTAEAGKEPLRTLALYRRSADSEVLFGWNMIHESTGTVFIGDRIALL